MTPTEITALARQYAEQNPPQCEDEKLRQDGIYLNATMVFEPFLKWLCKTHCIVPKVDVLNQHAWYMQRMKEVSSNRRMNRGKAIALENLFGKDLFNEEEQ